MQRKDCKIKLTGFLAVLLALALAVSAAFPMHARAEAIDLGKDCDIKLTLAGGVVDGDAEIADLITIDVYKIADAKVLAGYDAYAFDAGTTDFSSLAGELAKLVDVDDTTVTADAFAQAAADLVQKTDAIEPIAQGEVDKTIDKVTVNGSEEALGAGLYLMLARGTNLTEKTYVDHSGDNDKAFYFDDYDDLSYFDKLEVNGGADDDIIVTIARSSKYTYYFEPVLVSLPTRGSVIDENGKLIVRSVDEDGNVITADQALTSDPEDWVYSYTADLKPSRDIRRTAFEIRKSLKTYENRQPVTFVFQIDYQDYDKSDVSLIRQMEFNDAELQTITIDDIPIGAEVTVTEVYSGANYHVVGSASQTTPAIELPPVTEEVNGVTFENDYDNSDKGGGSIENVFEYVTGTDGNSWHLVGTDDEGNVLVDKQ